jgi:hypothetical protein
MKSKFYEEITNIVKINLTFNRILSNIKKGAKEDKTLLYSLLLSP